MALRGRSNVSTRMHPMETGLRFNFGGRKARDSKLGVPVTIGVGNYTYNLGVLCIGLFEGNGSKEVMTVSLGNSYGDYDDYPLPDYCTFIDMRHRDSRKFIEWLKTHGIAKQYMHTCADGSQIPVSKPLAGSGVEAPLYQFDRDVLRYYDPDGCKTYEEAYVMRRWMRRYLSNEDYARIYASEREKYDAAHTGEPHPALNVTPGRNGL